MTVAGVGWTHVLEGVIVGVAVATIVAGSNLWFVRIQRRRRTLWGPL